MTINTTHHSARVSLMTVICKFWKYEMRRYIPYLYCLIFDTFSTLFAGLHCWFGGETCTSQCHFQFIKVALIDNSSMHTRISSSGSCLKTLIWWNGCAMCGVEADLCYMHVGLTFPGCSMMIGRRWPYIPHVHYFMCIT